MSQNPLLMWSWMILLSLETQSKMPTQVCWFVQDHQHGSLDIMLLNAGSLMGSGEQKVWPDLLLEPHRRQPYLLRWTLSSGLMWGDIGRAVVSSHTLLVCYGKLILLSPTLI